MSNTSNITNMPDLKKLFVYVNFTNVDAQGGLKALKGQLKTSSKTKYPERVFYVANDGSIITHGEEFGISDDLRTQINGLATDSVNFKSSIKNLTGIDVPVGNAAEITPTSLIGKYVAKEILKNKTIVASKENTAITVEETTDTPGTTTYTIGLTVDDKTIVTDGGKLKTAVSLVKKYCADETPSVNSKFYDSKAEVPSIVTKPVHPVILLTDKGGAILDIVDGNEFVTDGMLDTVVYDDTTGVLTFTWNTASGKKDSTNIDIAKIFQIEDIHTKTPNYITVKKETPDEHGTGKDNDKSMAYHIDAVVDATDLKTFSSVSHTAATEGVDEKYATNYDNNDALSNALSKVSGLVDANKVAAKIAQIDKDIVAIGNDAIAREKAIGADIDEKIAYLQRQLTEEVTNRGNADAALYGEAIPEAGPVNTIKKNADAIATLNGADTVDGSVAQKIKALKEELDAEVEYKDANNLVKVAISQVDGVVVKKDNAVTVKTATLTVGVDQDAEYTLDAASPSGYTQKGGYKAKSIDQIASADPSLVTNQDAWIYGQCIKTQAVNSIASDNNQYIKIVREDNQTKVAFEPWIEIHTIDELVNVGAETK